MKVTFLPMAVTVDGARGESILDLAQKNHVRLDHACGGNCACSTCHVIVRKGMEHLSEMEEDESDQLDEAAGLTLDSRLGCQARIARPEGEIVVEIPEYNRNAASELDSH